MRSGRFSWETTFRVLEPYFLLNASLLICWRLRGVPEQGGGEEGIQLNYETTFQIKYALRLGHSSGAQEVERVSGSVEVHLTLTAPHELAVTLHG